MRVEILDHGFIELIETWGSEERIIEAARMSTNKGFQGWGPIHNRECELESELNGPGECVRFGCEPKPGDEKLLSYLWKNGHFTPFEMAGAVIVVQAPIFVFREWHRHRTQCLTGDTFITCVTPTGTSYKRTIKELFDLKHGGVIDNAPTQHRNGTSRAGTPVYRTARRKHPWRVRVLPNCQNRTLRVLNEKTMQFETAPMADVWESGAKQVFSVETDSGRRLRTSAEHPFFTDNGWVKMKDLVVGMKLARLGPVAANDRPIPPALRQGIGVWTSMMRRRLIAEVDACYLCGNKYQRSDLVLDHVVPVSASLVLALDPGNLKPACEPCHRNKTNSEQPGRRGATRRGIRWETIVRIAPASVEMTYDIEVSGANHNYLANDLVVHNSYNELSARYTPLPDVNYMPTVDRCIVVPGANKQANSANGRVPTHKEVIMWLEDLAHSYELSQAAYKRGLDIGIPKEIARLPVPVARYSRMMASTNLRNWTAFLGLRNHPAAQWEIREFAAALENILKAVFPRTIAMMRDK